MNRRTRIFLFVAAGILVAGLGTGLVASYVGLQNLPVIGGNGLAEFAYVPEDAGLVAYLTLPVAADAALADAHARAAAVKARIRDAQPEIADVIVHTEPGPG